MKVFGIGLNKTGTKTLGRCFEELGFLNTSYNLELLMAYYEGNTGIIYKHIDKYSGFEDWPWPLMYKELEKKFSESKFILTTRSTPEVWYNSLVKHAKRTGPTLARKLVYGYEDPFHHKEHHIKIYNNHIRDVLEYFSDKPEKLLHVCWEDGDGWDKLCPFLNLSIPNKDFPHLNQSR